MLQLLSLHRIFQRALNDGLQPGCPLNTQPAARARSYGIYFHSKAQAVVRRKLWPCRLRPSQASVLTADECQASSTSASLHYLETSQLLFPFLYMKRSIIGLRWRVLVISRDRTLCLLTASHGPNKDSSKLLKLTLTMFSRKSPQAPRYKAKEIPDTFVGPRHAAVSPELRPRILFSYSRPL